MLRKAKDAATLFHAELSVLTALSSSPRHATHNVVRLLDSFQHDQHYCIVMENMHCNLRYSEDETGSIIIMLCRQATRVIGKHGRLPLSRLASFAFQMLEAFR